MSYSSKQSKPDSDSMQGSANVSTITAFSDQRASTAFQLKQQNMMRSAHLPNVIQQMIAEEEPIQGEFENEAPTQLQEAPAEKPNNTGLPDNLKSGIENLSGYSMDDVKVHYNSDKPAQLNAHAYAQGTDIHVASGQEQHLPHEAWHVVQQKQGRVQATMQMKSGVPVNDDAGLENEADVMGAKALGIGSNYAGAGYQLKARTINHVTPIQLAVSSTGTYTTGAALPTMTANTASVTGTKSLSGSPVSTSIYITSISSTSSPADPISFTKWKDYGGLNLLHEHSRSYNLTRMHAIRGKFHGPSSADNMILGTMASNNTHSNSHLNEVERPVENFINSTSGAQGVMYTVTPDFSSAPGYITARASNITNSTDKADFLAWAPEACPASFVCSVTFYKSNSASTTGYESKSDSTTISTAL